MLFSKIVDHTADNKTHFVNTFSRFDHMLQIWQEARSHFMMTEFIELAGAAQRALARTAALLEASAVRGFKTRNTTLSVFES